MGVGLRGPGFRWGAGSRLQNHAASKGPGGVGSGA